MRLATRLLAVVLAFTAVGVAQHKPSITRITLNSPNLTLNGIDPVYGPFGGIQMRYKGVSGDYGFFDPASGIQIVVPTGAVTAVSAQAVAGSYTSLTGFDIQGFQWWPGTNQFFTFEWGATGTFVTGQLADGTVEGWYDDFHFNDTSFIATPVLDATGHVLYYNSQTYAVPNGTNTQILAANEYGRAGTFENPDGSRSGFVDRAAHHGEFVVVSAPGASVTITALDGHCYAGFLEAQDGSRQAFKRCHDGPFEPVTVGVGGTWIMQITRSGDLVGYAQDASGNNFGFLWKH